MKKLLLTVLFWSWLVVRSFLLVLWIILRPALRFIGAVLMVAAVFALTSDITRWQVGEMSPLFHSLAYHIQAAAPATFKAMAAAGNRFHPVVWDYGFFAILSLPAWLVFALLSIAIVVAGRERRRVSVYIN